MKYYVTRILDLIYVPKFYILEQILPFFLPQIFYCHLSPQPFFPPPLSPQDTWVLMLLQGFETDTVGLKQRE